MTYTEKRKADREAMAAILEKIIVDHGATFTREENAPFPGERCIMLNVSASRGLRISVDLDGDSPQPDTHVMSWCVGPGSDARLSTFFGNVNEYHYRKSTDVAHGFDQLCEILAKRLDMARDGSAFDLGREAEVAVYRDAARRKQAPAGPNHT